MLPVEIRIFDQGLPAERMAAALRSRFNMFCRSIAVVFLLIFLPIIGKPVNAAEITVLSANGAKLILTALVPEFERTTNHKLTIAYGEAGVL